MGERPQITVDGVSFEWDRERGEVLASGKPAAIIWIETTLAGLMHGLQKMVGTDRFVLAVEQAGRESIEGDVRDLFPRFPTTEAALTRIGKASGTCGLGDFEIVSLDREKKEARFRSFNGWEGVYQRALGVAWGSSLMAGRFAGYASKIFGTYCRAEQVASIALGDAYDEFVVRPAARTLDDDLDELIREEKGTREDLARAITALRGEIEERERAENELRREVQERARIEEELRGKLLLIRRQEDALRAASTPILRLWEGILTMPVIGLVDSARAAQMLESLLEEITKTQARFTILDLTGVDVMDSDAASHLLKLVSAARLLGTRCLISGISPAMATTMVGLGLELGELSTFGSLEAALRYAIHAGPEEVVARKKAPPHR
jgi:rsbT co-antagonist protein RsbR